MRVDVSRTTPAAILRAGALLDRLPAGEVVGAEIGVFRGQMSYVLLCRSDLTLYMVDNWVGNDDYPGYHRAIQPEVKANAIANTEFAGERAKIVCMDSAQAAKTFEDGALDFVFIDADHSYAGCKSDIEAWLPKLKKGGLLSGHDYDNPNYPFGKEVKRAVDEAVAANGWALDLGRNKTWFVRV